MEKTTPATSNNELQEDVIGKAQLDYNRFCVSLLKPKSSKDGKKHSKFIEFKNMLESEMKKRRSSFFWNWLLLYKAFCDGRFYTLKMKRKNEPYSILESKDFLEGGLLKAFCVITPKNEFEYLWVEESSRNKGIATLFVEKMQEKKHCKAAVQVVSEAVDFWEKRGIKILSRAPDF